MDDKCLKHTTTIDQIAYQKYLTDLNPKEQIQNQMHQNFFLPLGGQGNSYSACPSASCMTRESFALPSHPECTYINRMLKLHAHISFWVMSLRLFMNVVVLPDGAEAFMCVPSMAYTHFC